MARDLSVDVRRFIVAALNADGSRTKQITEGRAFGPSIPNDVAWPFVRVDLPITIPAFDGCSDASDYIFRVNGFTAGDDESAGGELNAAIAADLDGLFGPMGVAVFAAPPPMILDADIASETYALDGAPVAFADVFGAATIDGAAGHVPNVGFVCNKAVGAAALQRIQIPFTPAVFALANVPGGVNVVVDYKLEDVVSVLPTSANATIGVRYFRNAGGWPLFYTANSGLDDNSALFVQSQDYDYDSAVGADHLLHTGIAGSSANLQLVAGLGDIITSYFGDDIGDVAVADAAHQWPHPNADTLQMYMSAASHHAGDLVNTTVKLTVTRIRIYTPARAAGWMPDAPVEIMPDAHVQDVGWTGSQLLSDTDRADGWHGIVSMSIKVAG